MNEIEKLFYFQKLELKLLLLLKGTTSLYGFSLEEAKEIGQQEVNRCIFELSKKKYLSVQGNQLVIADEIDELVSGLITAKKVLIVSSKDESVPESCIYLGKRAVISHAVGKHIRMEYVEIDDVYDKLIASGFEIVTEEEAVRELVSDESKLNVNDEEYLLALSNELYLLDKHELNKREEISHYFYSLQLGNKSKECQVVLLTIGFRDYFIVSDGGKGEVYTYSKESLKKWFSQYVRGDMG